MVGILIGRSLFCVCAASRFASSATTNSGNGKVCSAATVQAIRIAQSRLNGDFICDSAKYRSYVDQLCCYTDREVLRVPATR
jgi:hypothetical protein